MRSYRLSVWGWKPTPSRDRNRPEAVIRSELRAKLGVNPPNLQIRVKREMIEASSRTAFTDPRR